MRVAVFIDGNNFYYRLHFLSGNDKSLKLLDFKFFEFCKKLCGDDQLTEVRYYIGVIRRQKNNPKSQLLYNNQQKLFRKLQAQNIHLVLGQLIQHPDKSYHEKGVDVRIAVEMIRLARQDKYDIAYLLSSDTDLVPAVEEVRDLGKKVKYIGAGDRQSFGLTSASNEYLILRPEDVKPFFLV